MTPTEFKRNQILSILIDGNRYSEIKRNKKGEIIELIPISVERVKKDHDRAEIFRNHPKATPHSGLTHRQVFSDCNARRCGAGSDPWQVCVGYQEIPDCSL
jgi:phage portal protein BeeE